MNYCVHWAEDSHFPLQVEEKQFEVLKREIAEFERWKRTGLVGLEGIFVMVWMALQAEDDAVGEKPVGIPWVKDVDLLKTGSRIRVVSLWDPSSIQPLSETASAPVLDLTSSEHVDCNLELQAGFRSSIAILSIGEHEAEKFKSLFKFSSKAGFWS